MTYQPKKVKHSQQNFDNFTPAVNHFCVMLVWCAKQMQ